MTFEFVIACIVNESNNIRRLLTDLLGKVLEDNLNEFEEDEVVQMLHLRHEKRGAEMPDDSGGSGRYTLFGFSLEFPEDVSRAQTVIEEFAAALPDTSPIVHVVLFEDPILQATLAQRASEIYLLEMKLRRVLSYIYLHAYQGPDNDPYNLLCEETVQPMAKESPKREQMKAAAENQFFHLTFGQYVGLNRRPEFKLNDLLKVIRSAAQYDVFRTEILRVPIENEVDAGLLAGLKERMDAIEAMRNCVAHNRRPTRKVINNYENARPILDQLLDDYLVRCEILDS